MSISTSGAQGNGYSWAVGISAYGRFVVFNSDATNLVPGDTNTQSDVFVRDRRSGETTRVSVTSSGAQADQSPNEFGGSRAGGISANGRYVAFGSDATNLVPHDTNRAGDVFVHDSVTGKTQRVSVSSSGRQANRPAVAGIPAISADGRYVAFMSTASNLVRGDTNRKWDVFVHDRVTGKTQRVSVSSAGRQANGDNEASPAISASGRYVAFASFASNLVPGDSNGAGDDFIHDRVTHRTLLASLSSTGEQGNDSSYVDTGALSADARYLAFSSWASNLAPDANPAPDVFVRDFGAPLDR